MITSTVREINYILQKEINWCLDNLDKDLNQDQRLGFMNGLRQAQYLVKEAERIIREDNEMIEKESNTYRVKIYLSGSIDMAKQIIRKYCLDVGLCVTIEPTTYIYAGGEEDGYVVGLINYPRFPADVIEIHSKAFALAHELLEGTYQHSVLIMTPQETTWITKRE